MGGEMAERRRFCRLEGLGGGLRGEGVFREGPLRAGDLGEGAALSSNKHQGLVSSAVA